MYKLVAIDVDGTLLNSNKVVSDENKDALNALIENGIMPVICTGRAYQGVKQVLYGVQSSDWYIAYNGSVVVNSKTKEYLLNETLDTNSSLEAIRILDKMGIYYHIFINDIMYTRKIESLSLEYYEQNKVVPEDLRIEIRVVDDLTEQVLKGDNLVTKFISVSDDLDLLEKSRKAVTGIENVDVVSSGRDNFEIVKKGLSKGTALELLANHFGYEKSQVVAIGDNENDIPMIKYAGLGIAMGNATEFAKDIADVVTLTNNENGFAYAVRNYILKF